MIIFEADDPLVLDGTYDQEGYKPGERARIQKAHVRTQQEDDSMAKKKPAAKKKAPAGPKFPKKKPTAARGSKKTTPTFRGSSRTRAAAPRGPRSQTLPGMAQVRDAKLDQICEDIGDGLDQINAGTEAVDEGKLAAIQRLHSRNLSGYRHAGVRLSIVPGAEKVSVKREKDREVTIAEGAGSTNQINDENPTGGTVVDLNDGEGTLGDVASER